jgi:hypothetical protein
MAIPWGVLCPLEGELFHGVIRVRPFLSIKIWTYGELGSCGSGAASPTMFLHLFLFHVAGDNPEIVSPPDGSCGHRAQTVIVCLF